MDINHGYALWDCDGTIHGMVVEGDKNVTLLGILCVVESLMDLYTYIILHMYNIYIYVYTYLYKSPTILDSGVSETRNTEMPTLMGIWMMK